MKRILSLMVVGMLVPAWSWAEPGALYEKYSRSAKVPVFVELPADETPKKDGDPAGLKASLEEALKARKSIRFEVVQDKSQAEIAISSRITERIWAPVDPIDMIVGVGAAAMDAAVQEPYARMQGHFFVTEVRSGRALWKEELTATITKGGMTEADSLPLIREDMARVFVREALGKKKVSRGAAR